MSTDAVQVAKFLRSYLIDAKREVDIETEIYRRFQNISQVHVSWSAGVVRRIVEAAAGHRRVWQNGWTFVSRTSFADILEFAGLRFQVHSDRVRYDRSPQLGDRCSVQVPSLSLEASPGYASVFFTPDVQADFRVYVNPDWNKLAELVHRLLVLGDQMDSVLSFKILTSDRDRGRADAIVVYCRNAGSDDVLRTCDALVTALAGHTAAPVPCLTHRLDTGIAIARQPSGQRSFGLFVSRILARALVSTEQLAEDELVEVMLNALVQAGINPGAVWALGDRAFQDTLLQRDARIDCGWLV